ncbi:uncharacterized protein LOC109831050 [Asparagus officinalis]|uniref:uncharacterized protein LOC109831050 n=2 Tax=Asparagus officinalis TaxID=4686 RepID=UPI00098DEC57|nr:uncharacterized protein LOC109831050 [Asparagus officinalis]
MNHYCLEDNPDSWDYVMSRASKMLRGWRSRLKSQYFTDITIDWKRIHQLDKRVPPYNWMTLIIEWEGEKKDKCSIASANRGAKLYDHFLGATPYARIEHKYLRENPDALTMPPTLLARNAYTPPEGYDKVEKMTKIKDMHEALEASQDFVLSQSQSIENTPTDPNRMTREQWREIVDGVYGSKPIKKGRVPLSSAKVRIVSTSRNIQNDSSATSNRPSVTSYVVAKIGQYLMDNVQPSMFFQFIPIITRELGGAQSTWDVVQRLSDCPSLKEILPESIYLEIFKLAFAEHEVHGGGEVGGGIVGSSSTIRRSNADDADNRDADDDEE